MPFSCKIEESESEYMRDRKVIETDRLTDRGGTYKERETDRHRKKHGGFQNRKKVHSSINNSWEKWSSLNHGESTYNESMKDRY